MQCKNMFLFFLIVFFSDVVKNDSKGEAKYQRVSEKIKKCWYVSMCVSTVCSDWYSVEP